MRITILSVGRLKNGPEKEMLDDYVDRFRKAGRNLGFRSLDVIDVDSGGGKDAEGSRLITKIPRGAAVLRLDEHGPQLTSKVFASRLAKLRDAGTRDLAFLIGGAEGYSRIILETYPDQLALGVQTWPHRLVKVMLSEQIYRAASLLAGAPYHKA